MKGASEQHAAIDTFCYNALMNAAILALSVPAGQKTQWQQWLSS